MKESMDDYTDEELDAPRTFMREDGGVEYYTLREEFLRKDRSND